MILTARPLKKIGFIAAAAYVREMLERGRSVKGGLINNNNVDFSNTCLLLKIEKEERRRKFRRMATETASL